MKERLLTDVRPVEVLRYFEDMTFIPRESENEKEMAEYLVDFAVRNGLGCHMDETYNVLMTKPASPGYEDHPIVIIQAHMDMVCEKLSGSDHDFAKDPIVFTVEDGWITAKETSLGADDGIGLAIGLAVMADKNLKHPEIELLCTADEERGLIGIEKFDFSLLKGSRVINIDGADEHFVIAGCAGGPIVRTDFPMKTKPADRQKSYYRLTLGGLRGGHSGEDIHRGRANANKTLVRVLMAIREEMDFDLAEINGGLKFNAIPRDAEAVIAVNSNDTGALMQLTDMYARTLSEEYEVNDPGITLRCEPADSRDSVFDDDLKMNVLDFINFADIGVIRRNIYNPAMIETSANMGIVSTDDEKVRVMIMARSSRTSMFDMMSQKIRRLSERLGGICHEDGRFPAWEYRADSPLREAYKDAYSSLYGKEPAEVVYHAGLEPATFAEKMTPVPDMIAIGPDVRNLHAPGESLNIASTERVWNSVIKLLEKL